MPTGPTPAAQEVSNLYTLPSVDTSATWTYPYWTTTHVQDPDAGRFRFALELVAAGKLTKEAMVQIAKKALREEK